MSRIDRQTPLAPQRSSGAANQPSAKEATPSVTHPAAFSRDQTSVTAREGRELRDFSSFLQNQNEKGITNGCGTTSLAMLLSAWKNQPGAYTRESIDRSIRHFNMPTSPQNVVGFARSQGFRAEARNNASLDDLKGMLDKGVPVQVMYDPDGNGSDSTLHYVVVTDYEADAKGRITGLKIADPWGGEQKTVPVDEFRQRWDKLQLLGHSTGLNNLMIPVLPTANTPIKGKDGQVRNSDDIQLPKSTGLGWRMGVADKAFDLANGAAKLGNAIASAPGKIWKAVSHL